MENPAQLGELACLLHAGVRQTPLDEYLLDPVQAVPHRKLSAFAPAAIAFHYDLVRLLSHHRDPRPRPTLAEALLLAWILCSGCHASSKQRDQRDSNDYRGL
jgi:hypothetical protein